MSDAKLRHAIAFEAARLMYERVESEYFTAKRKAARQMGVDHRYRPKDLPSNSEIRDQIQSFARFYEGDKRDTHLRHMRLAALRMMRLLEAFHPKLIGSVLTGHVRKGSDIDLHVFTDHVSHLTAVLEDNHLRYGIERKRIIKANEERHFTHIHMSDEYEFELTVYSHDKLNYPFKSSITGSVIEKATIPQLIKRLEAEYPGIDIDSEIERTADHIDRFELYRMLLAPLEDVKQNPAYHPEGDALYHSLQVFELARYERSWDEEFMTAALLHDVGKSIDPRDHVAAGLAALEGSISARVEFLIRHHMDVHLIRDGTIGHRAKIRLQESEDFDDLMLLGELDRRGRIAGAQVCGVADAIAYLRAMDAEE